MASVLTGNIDHGRKLIEKTMPEVKILTVQRPVTHASCTASPGHLGA